jgi:hypothetical protein
MKAEISLQLVSDDRVGHMSERPTLSSCFFPRRCMSKSSWAMPSPGLNSAGPSPTLTLACECMVHMVGGATQAAGGGKGVNRE